jgi:hypothetical protein
VIITNYLLLHVNFHLHFPRKLEESSPVDSGDSEVASLQLGFLILRAPGSGSRLIALWQENQPHELQHRSHEVDEDSSKKRPKPIQHRNVIDLQRNRDDPDAKQWEEQHPIHPFEFGWGEAARGLEVEDRERNLAG